MREREKARLQLRAAATGDASRLPESRTLTARSDGERTTGARRNQPLCFVIMQPELRTRTVHDDEKRVAAPPSLPLCPAPRRCWLGQKEEREMRGLLAQGLAVNRDDALKTRIFKQILPPIYSLGCAKNSLDVYAIISPKSFVTIIMRL